MKPAAREELRRAANELQTLVMLGEARLFVLGNTVELDVGGTAAKVALERELKELDAQTRAERKASKEAVTLQEKLDGQRRVKALEERRHLKRKQLFEAQDDIDRRRTGFIEDIEKRLGTSATRHIMFSLRWTLT